MYMYMYGTLGVLSPLTKYSAALYISNPCYLLHEVASCTVTVSFMSQQI